MDIEGWKVGGGLVTNLCPILVTPWTIVRQASLSMGFPRQEYQSGLPFPSPGDLPNQGSNLGLLHCRQILYWLSHQGSLGVKNGSVFIPIPKKGNAKECSNYHTIALISHASKVMLKILQARLQQYMNQELPDVQGGFRKGRGTRDQIANICRIIEKAREFQKNTSASLTMLKPLTVWITTNCGKFLKRWKYQTSWPAFWETCMQFKKQQLELDMEQWTGSKIGKGVRQGCILSPCLFNLYAEYIMRNGGWSTSWNQDFKEKYQ